MVLRGCVLPLLRAAGGRKHLKDKAKRKTKRGATGDDSVGVELSSSTSMALGRHNDSVVRIVLACGMVELYEGVVVAHTVMEKHPGLCIARPEVFRSPHDSVVSSRETLLPGQKFYLIPVSTLNKLRRKIPDRSEHRDAVKAANKETDDNDDDKETVLRDSICYAREYYLEKEQWSECSFRRMARLEEQQEEKKEKKEEKEKQMKQKLKEIVISPTRRMRSTPRRFYAWEPSLPSVQEVSP